MAWAETEKVGCGVEFCDTLGVYIVCNYNIGNRLGDKIYVAAKSSNHPSEFSIIIFFFYFVRSYFSWKKNF